MFTNAEGSTRASRKNSGTGEDRFCRRAESSSSTSLASSESSSSSSSQWSEASSAPTERDRRESVGVEGAREMEQCVDRTSCASSLVEEQDVPKNHRKFSCNGSQSTSDRKASYGSLARFRKSKRENDPESHLSFASTYITLTPEEKEWMVVSATADYQEMFRLLCRNSHLAKLKDLSNGYTGLHWACKLGQIEVVKMLANKIGVNVNQRSHGYTPLHLAAMQGHADVMELLINVYKADPNIRDYSGKKARQLYLQHPAALQPAPHTQHQHQHQRFWTYTEGDYDVVFSVSQGYAAPRTTYTIFSNSSSSSSSSHSVNNSSSISGGGGSGSGGAIGSSYSSSSRDSSSSSLLQMPVSEGIDVLKDGEVLEADDWVLL